jgi:methionine-rich copper-binding protein CopC
MSSVATQATGDAGGGLNVGWINQGDWMEYIVNVATAGAYTVKFRVATADNGASFLMDDGSGNTYAQVAVPNTGGFQTYGTATAKVNLKAGVQTIRLMSTAFFQWNINWIEFDSGTAGTNDAGAAVSGAAVSSFNADSSLGHTPVMLLYPNPTPDAFYLDMNDSHTGKLQVQVINQTGRLVKTYSFEKGLSQMQVQVSLAGLPAGVYVIRIGGDSWQEVRKVIKL